MLLTKLLQGLGALSLAHFALAAEGPLDRRTDGDGDYNPLCWGCPKTATVTKTASASTVTVTKTASASTVTVTKSASASTTTCTVTVTYEHLEPCL